MNDLAAVYESPPPPPPKSMFDLHGDFMMLLSIAALGYDPETGEVLSEEDVDAAFASLRGDIERKVAGSAYVVKRLLQDAEDIDTEMKRLASKRDAIRRGAERLKDRIRGLMATTDVKKVSTPGISVSLGKMSTRVEVDENVELEEQYLNPPAKRSPSLKALEAAIKAGVVFKGVRIVDGTRKLLIS